MNKPQRNQPFLFDRLVGLETEYAIRFHSTGGGERPTNFQLYHSLLAPLKSQVLTVDASHIKDGLFTANGGAVWFERIEYSGGWGLIEGSSPECRGPRQMLLYQRAQDHLLGQSARKALCAGEMTLIKNDRDSRDNVYGAQENYEATIAEGGSLWMWRIGLCLLFPLTVLSWVGILFQLAAVILYLLVTGLLYALMRPLLPEATARQVQRLFFGEFFADGREDAPPFPGWMERLHVHLLRLTTAPLAAGLWILVWAAAFRRTRRLLLPFLISRAVIGGAGTIDSYGRFHLADKAPAMNALLGFGGFFYERPVFTFGHFLKLLAFEAWWSPRDFARLFHPRQRLQICLGDSNMSQEAEFLRIGATLLVLDAIEAGEVEDVGSLRRPIAALRRICADPTLQERMSFAGRSCTAVEVQRFYFDACERHVNRTAAMEAANATQLQEAREVLRRWREALDALEEDPSRLVGRLDWVTKKHFLDEAPPDMPWEARKKIDIRYHELSPEGYFQRLEPTGLTPSFFTAEELQAAVRLAPSGTPATTRGHYIREFSQGAMRLRVNWNSVVLGAGRGAKVVWLGRYKRRPAG